MFISLFVFYELPGGSPLPLIIFREVLFSNTNANAAIMQANMPAIRGLNNTDKVDMISRQ